jgi:hypothetical protein
MSETITNVRYETFQSLIDSYIECSSHEDDTMPVSTFFKLLFERMAERSAETIELEGEIINNQLVMHLLARVETAVQVQGNEILIDNRRIVVRRRNSSPYPTAG